MDTSTVCGSEVESDLQKVESSRFSAVIGKMQQVEMVKANG